MFAKKSLGQNFLMHTATAERIASAAQLAETDTVLEIGPGTGMLTKVLLEKSSHVYAVEADAQLIPGLEETFSPEIAAGKLTILHADIRTFNPKVIGKPYKLVANIPYYITGEIFRQFLTAEIQPLSITVLVQKEVAERVARSKKESLLSLSVKAFGTPIYMFTVPRGAFKPAPKVDSAVLHIADISRVRFRTGNEARFFELIRAGFAHKRKQLLKNLEHLSSSDTLKEVFAELRIPEKVRSEELKLEQWLSLSERI